MILLHVTKYFFKWVITYFCLFLIAIKILYEMFFNIYFTSPYHLSNKTASKMYLKKLWSNSVTLF